MGARGGGFPPQLAPDHLRYPSRGTPTSLLGGGLGAGGWTEDVVHRPPPLRDVRDAGRDEVPEVDALQEVDGAGEIRVALGEVGRCSHCIII